MHTTDPPPPWLGTLSRLRKIGYAGTSSKAHSEVGCDKMQPRIHHRTVSPPGSIVRTQLAPRDPSCGRIQPNAPSGPADRGQTVARQDIACTQRCGQQQQLTERLRSDRGSPPELQRGTRPMSAAHDRCKPLTQKETCLLATASATG